jgi:hypothetical protein
MDTFRDVVALEHCAILFRMKQKFSNEPTNPRECIGGSGIVASVSELTSGLKDGYIIRIALLAELSASFGLPFRSRISAACCSKMQWFSSLSR